MLAADSGLRGCWFVATVIAAKSDKIRVRFNELLSDDGTHKLEEWAPLEPVRPIAR